MYQGVQCRTTGEPILYANNPKGVSRETRRRGLDALKTLNEYELSQYGDPETIARIGQFELAYRMQVAVPEVMDIGRETKGTLEAYGAQPGAASFANNCLLARAAGRARGPLRAVVRLGLGLPRYRRGGTTSSTTCPTSANRSTARFPRYSQTSSRGTCSRTPSWCGGGNSGALR